MPVTKSTRLRSDGLQEVIMARREFDLVVIGAGMAGFAAIGKAAVVGAKAAIIEKGELGGT